MHNANARGGRLAHDWYPRPLPENVEIGADSWIYSSFAFVHCRSELPTAVQTGHACGIYHGSFFELGPSGQVRIGDFSALVGVVVATNSLVEIGRYCFLAHDVVLADTATAVPWDPSDRCLSAPSNTPSIVLGDDVWVGARAIILQGARIGNGAIIGAGARVEGSVPDYAIVGGNPAKVVGFARETR